MLRLDRYLTACGAASRKEAASLIRRGAVAVSGKVVRDPAYKLDEGRDAVTLSGQPLCYRKYIYVMLNKPEGYVSATEDAKLPYVLTLLPDAMQKRGLFPVGRLDKDTTGLLLMTDDGELAHRLLSPKRGISKCYAFTCRDPLTVSDVEAFASGITTLAGESFRPAQLRMSEGDPLRGTVVLTEGKYHEVKRMFQSRGNLITSLERISFADIPLDPALARAQWRLLSDEEIAYLRRAADLA